MTEQQDSRQAIQQFGSVAERYCELVDGVGTLDRNELLLKVYRLLPGLIDQAIRLPKLEYSDDDGENPEQEARIRQARERSQMKVAEWGRLFNLLKDKLGGWDAYMQVWDPTKNSEAIHGSLADDIADIYRDLREGIRLSKEDDVQPIDVIFEWRFNFYTHWGRHATNALRTMHFLLADELADTL